MLRVFISYCTRDNEARPIIEATRSRLTKDHHHVFLDADVLRPGEEWRPRINQELAECGVAIIFLSEEGLKSPWVRREIEILLWRRDLGAPVTVVPVLLDGLPREQLKDAGFEDLYNLEYATVSSSETPGEAAQKILAGFAQLPAAAAGEDSDKMTAWINRLAEYLSEAQQTDFLLRAAVALGIPAEDLPRVMLPVDGCRFFASQMLDRTQSGKLRSAIAEIAAPLNSDRLHRLIQQVEATWVDPVAARLVLQATDDSTPTVLLLNADQQVTGEQYVDRAHCCAPIGFDRTSIAAIVGEEGELGLIAQYEQALRALCWDLALADPEDDDQYSLVIKPEPRRFRESLAAARKLQGKFPRLRIILLTGAAGVTEQDWSERDDLACLALEPALADGDEDRGRLLGSQLRRLYERTTGGRYQQAAG